MSPQSHAYHMYMSNVTWQHSFLINTMGIDFFLLHKIALRYIPKYLRIDHVIDIYFFLDDLIFSISIEVKRRHTIVIRMRK